MKKLLVLLFVAISSSAKATTFIEYAENISDQSLRSTISANYPTDPEPCIPNPMTGFCEIGDDEGLGNSPLPPSSNQTDYWYFIKDGLNQAIKYKVSVRSNFIVITRVSLNAEDLSLSQEIIKLRQEFRDNGGAFSNWWHSYQNFPISSYSAKSSGECNALGVRESIDSAFDFFSNASEAGELVQNLSDWYTPPGFLERVRSLSTSGVGWAVAGNTTEPVLFADGSYITFGMEPIGDSVMSYVILGESHASDGSLLSNYFTQVGDRVDKTFKLKTNIRNSFTDPCAKEEFEDLLAALGANLSLDDQTGGYSAGDTCYVIDGLDITYRVFNQTATIAPDGKGGYIMTITGSWSTTNLVVSESLSCPG